MVELTPGSQVFVYQNHIHQAMARASYKSAASFLLNCFYTNDELVGMNLTGANGKKCPDKEILQSIIGMCAITWWLCKLIVSQKLLFFNFPIHKFTTHVVMIFDPLYRICHERIPKAFANWVLSEAGFKKQAECFGIKKVKEGWVKI